MTEEQAAKLLASVKVIEVVLVGLGGGVVAAAITDFIVNFL